MAKVKDLLVNGSSRFIGKIYASDQFISQVANGTAPFVVSSSTVVANLNADMTDGLHVHTGRNNEVNKIVRTDGSGYIQTGYINTNVGTENLAISRIFYEYNNDGYIRKMSPSSFFSVFENSGNDISITVAGQNRKLTVGYASNSDTATKLQTARLIWGQSFDGTADVNGDIIMNGSSVLSYNGAISELQLGPGTLKDAPVGVYGTDVKLYSGGRNFYPFILNANGNVLIGTTTDSGAKLQVTDNTRRGNIATQIKTSALVEIGAIESGNDALYIGQLSNSIIWIQSAYGGSSSIPSANYTYPLVLNPLGGNVGIGTISPSYKLDISGSARATNNLLADGIIGCTQSSGDHSYGLSLYRAPNNVTNWGITAGLTSSGGTHGDVTDDWALYFHCAGASTRGFIFTRGKGTNVASISARGYITAPKLFMPVGDKKLSSVNPIGHVKGDIHLYTNNYGSGTALTDGNVASITFGTGTGTDCQAGIYCVTSGSYGTKFIIGTTDSYAAGVRYNTIIDNQGYITSSGFCKSGSSNSYLLLGGGSHLHLDRVVEVKRGSWTDAISNCNSMSTTGIYSYSSATNRPSGTTWGSWLNIRLYDSDNNYHRQLFFDCYNSDKIWTRSCDNGTWTTWKEIISSANIGSQSVAYAASAGSLATTYYWANVAISTSQNNETTPIVNTIRTNIVGLRGSSGDGSYGISLYNGTGYHKQYGIWMGLTSVGGTFGYVTGDWAGYYTMDGATNRGWIWRHGNSTNVASISAAGNFWCGLATFKCGYFHNSNPSLGSLDSGTICIRASDSNGSICDYGLYIWDDYLSGCASLQSGYQNSASSNALSLSLQPLGGNVGIGTQSPSSKLDVVGSIYYSYGSYLRNTTVSSEALVLRGNNSGQYIRLSDGNSGFGIVDAGWTNTFYIKNMKTYAELYHNTGQPLYINNCSVGIGVSSPSTKLHIRGTDEVSMSMDSNNEYRFSPSFKGGLHIDHSSHALGSGLNDGYIDGITFGVSSSAYAGIFVQNSGSYGSRIIFTTTNDYRYNKARMILTAGGDLGIGTMSPSYKLHVIGDVYANGGWLRSSGSTGWYNESYGGGWYMTDASWIRSYGGHGVVAGGFYHSSYGSSEYALTSNGGAAKISDMSVAYASSAGSVSWGNVTGKSIGLVIINKNNGTSSVYSSINYTGCLTASASGSGGTRTITITNNSSKAVRIACSVSSVYPANSYEFGWAHFTSSPSTSISANSSATFNISFGYIHCQGNWAAGDYVQRGSGGYSFSCIAYYEN